LQQLFPAQAGDIARRQQAFEAAWTARLGVWSERAAPLRGREVAAQHASFAYLWDWLGMRQRVDLEPRPGLSPTPGHLQGLLSVLRERPVTAIVVGRHQDPRAARWLAQQLGHGVPVLHWPATVEDPLEPDALGRWFDRLVDDLLRSGPSPTPAGSAPAGPR
jgi:zinc/manganese transport system substrate-binding protein